MSYYGEAATYYGNGGERPPYEPPKFEGHPPYDRAPPQYPPYEKPPFHGPPPHEGPPYEQPPPGYGSRPPPLPPPNYPPPPLPMGWVQVWEPRACRAYFAETATGRTEWTLPHDVMNSSPGGNNYALAPVPPQEGGYGQYPNGDPEGQAREEGDEDEEKKSDRKKLFAAGAVGLALGAVGGAILGHELADRGSSDEGEEEE
ncbi:hypothetical protein BJX61DRAFT_11952 [Aspergillus egyptiacus]|nr:hypothetical protein BJX61DRAFT_11952 [Aspergillus egyptiacus]